MEELEKNSTTDDRFNPNISSGKKSGGCLKGCLIALLILFFLFLLIVGAGYFGYRKFVKSMEQKDLGITYTEQDYLDVMEDIGLEADASQLCIDCPMPTFSEPHEVSVVVTDSQASAAFEYINQHLSYASVSGTQIDIKEDHAVLTTTLSYQSREFPIYMVGDISKNSESSITGSISELKAGAVKIPSTIISYVEDVLLNIANDKISQAKDSVRIDKLELTDEGVVYEGLIPTEAE